MRKLGAAGLSTSQTANVILVIAFEVDLPAIFETADAAGLLEAPYVWITADSCA